MYYEGGPKRAQERPAEPSRAPENPGELRTVVFRVTAHIFLPRGTLYDKGRSCITEGGFILPGATQGSPGERRRAQASPGETSRAQPSPGEHRRAQENPGEFARRAVFGIAGKFDRLRRFVEIVIVT